MGKEILTVVDLKKHFGTPFGTVRAVDGVSLSVREGETLGLVGESGSGKSTVAYVISGIYRPTEGSIRYREHEITKATKKRSRSLKKEIQIVFQDPGSSLNPRRSIKQILGGPIRVYSDRKTTQWSNVVAALLETVGLPIEYMHKYPRELGGGEKQMVAVARALATNPSFVVLDEPTSALDVSVQANVITSLMELQNEFELTYLFITHDLSLMRNMATSVAIMYLGKLCEVATTEDFFQSPLHPYTRMLLSSIPTVSDEEEALKPKTIQSSGEIPSPINIPPGCSFHLRCPEKEGICTRVDPIMIDMDETRSVRCHLYTESSRGSAERE